MSAPSSLPTHFIVYPNWFACDAVLGRELTRAEVDATILGGREMVAYEADWSALGRGDRPLAPPPGALLDELDVADLESEAEHAYVLGPARDADDMVVSRPTLRPTLEEGDTVADGFRARRTFDAFRLALPARPSTLVVRLISGTGATVRVEVDGHVEATFRVPPTAWREEQLAMPALAKPAVVRLLTDAGGTFGTGHYWLYAGGA
jgi:hypothetical protein